MACAKWVNYGLFFLGVFLLIGSLVVGIGALKYEFVYVSSMENPTDWNRPLYNYEELPATEQRIVDGAINGNRYVFDRQGPIPGGKMSSLGTQELMVAKEGTYHIFTHQITFVPTETAGLAAIALAFAGLISVIEAIRRHHFPYKQYPWQAG